VRTNFAFSKDVGLIGGKYPRILGEDEPLFCPTVVRLKFRTFTMLGETIYKLPYHPMRPNPPTHLANIYTYGPCSSAT